jgi:1-acyl-sn-glycerol-3-phosphate acyltransferase
MLDLARLKKLRINRNPWGQKTMANVVLGPDYRLPRRTVIDIEGLENLPDRPVIFAMNHTDMYNYWPFQYALYRQHGRFTCAWVKGKYYSHKAMAWFMGWCDNIPLPSRGYVLTTEFTRDMKRGLEEREYRALRTLIDGDYDISLPSGAAVFVEGRGGVEAFINAFEVLWVQMVDEVVRLNREAIAFGHSPLVFPQGTRSKRLCKGHVGLAQISQLLGIDIVPVGCNGSDKVYPGNSPFSIGGRIVYRVGKPLELSGPELGPHRICAPFSPFTREAMAAHGPAFEAITEIMMDRINELLDPEYQYSADRASDGVQGVNRFAL